MIEFVERVKYKVSLESHRGEEVCHDQDRQGQNLLEARIMKNHHKDNRKKSDSNLCHHPDLLKIKAQG